MSHTFLKVASVTLLTSAIIFFAVIYNANINLPSDSQRLTGAYWNLDAGFGDSELKFLDGSHYTNGGIRAVSVEGTYTLTHDNIIFLEYGPADAPCLHIPGRYQWRLNRKVLTLKEIDDQCPTRKFDWGSEVWIEQPETAFAHSSARDNFVEH